MVSAVEGLFGLVVLTGLALCALGYCCYRRWEQLGVEWLAGFFWFLGLGGIMAGLYGLSVDPGVEEVLMPGWGQIALVSWMFASVPWLVYALQYTGRYSRIRWRTIVLLYLPVSGILAIYVLDDPFTPNGGLLSAVATVVFVVYFGIGLVGSYLIAQAAYSDVRLDYSYGLAIACTPVVIIIVVNVLPVFQDVSVLLSVGLYALTLTLATVATGGALLIGRFLEWTPAVETIGERVIVRKTDDLVFVVDGDDRVVKCNETSVETLRVARHTVLDSPLTDTLGHDSDDLAALETVTLATDGGQRRYDPQVAPITNDAGVELGAVLSLRDVTERELREQRLAVLNRVLRHNLRNKVDVVKSHAEALADGEEHAETITDAADDIAELGHTARRIDQFVSGSSRTTELDLGDAVEETLTTARADDHDVTISLDLPDSASVETNRQALYGALDSAIDNAIEYADSEVEITIADGPEGYEVVVTDDGHGIPDDELTMIDEEIETSLQHGTGLGLWQLKWAVMTMGGELDFETDGGTTVAFTVPDRRVDAEHVVR